MMLLKVSEKELKELIVAQESRQVVNGNITMGPFWEFQCRYINSSWYIAWI